MSRDVPHIRPEFSAFSQFVSGAPVGSLDWQSLAGLANWSLGHGKCLIPSTAIGYDVTTGNTGTFRFFVDPAAAAVERIWLVELRASAVGTTAAITCGGASAYTARPPTVRDAGGTVFVIRESLSSKTSTAAGVSCAVAATGGTVTVVSIAMYEQTRGQLDTADSGVDASTLRPRNPITDVTNAQVAGVIDAYKAMDARRAGYFHWSTDTTAAIAITAGVGSPASLFALNPPTHAAQYVGITDQTLTVSVYAKVDAGTGTIKLDSTQAADSNTFTVTGTSYAWVTSSDVIAVQSENPTVVDGRRGSVWEDLAISAYVTSTNTLSIAAISIGREVAHLPI